MGTWAPGPGATSGADTFTGDGTAEIADGLGGNDILNGGGGSDALTGGAGGDTVNGEAGNDVLIVDDSHDGGSDVFNGGTEIDVLRFTGTASNQIFDFYFSTFSSIEGMEFSPTSGDVISVTFRIGQLGGISLSSQISGSSATDQIF